MNEASWFSEGSLRFRLTKKYFFFGVEPYLKEIDDMVESGSPLKY